MYEAYKIVNISGIAVAVNSRNIMADLEIMCQVVLFSDS